jgi:hypothetical protein
MYTWLPTCVIQQSISDHGRTRYTDTRRTDDIMQSSVIIVCVGMRGDLPIV